jgi:ABC-2 type transport system permease protein
LEAERVRRYLRLLVVQLRAAGLLSLQYRLDFIIQTFMVVVWSATALAPLLVLFEMRSSVAGFSSHEALMVSGCFIALKGLLQGVIQPSMTLVVEHVRKGTLDFLLLKPVDAQFMVSTAKIDIARLTDVLTGLALVVWAARSLAVPPSPAQFALGALLLVAGAVILYAIWIMVVSLSFRVVKVDNLSFLIGSAFDAARFPAGVFQGALALVFTFVLPLALMTTYPALALKGSITSGQVLTSLLVSGLFFGLSRFVWQRAIRHYTGAGG